MPINSKQKKIEPLKFPKKSKIQQILHQSKRREIQASVMQSNVLQTSIKQNQKESKVVIINQVALSSQPQVQSKKLTDRDSIALDLISNGYIQSFIDFMYTTGETLPNVMNKTKYHGEIIKQHHIESSYYMLSLNDWSNWLKRAQDNSRYSQPEKQKGIQNYHTLAEHCQEEHKDYKAAAYFQKRVIQMSKFTDQKQYTLLAKMAYGKCFDHQKRTDEAIYILQNCLGEVSIFYKAQNDQEFADSNQIIKLISMQLINIYMKMAQNFQKYHQDNSSALIYYQKCLEVARKASQQQSEGRICNKIGQLYYNSGQYQKAVQFQKDYLDIVKREMLLNRGQQGRDKADANIRIKMMKAHASLAKCYLKMKQLALAQNQLTQYNKIAKDNRLQNSVADSSYYLAKLYEEKGNQNKVIEYYKTYFQAAKSEKPKDKDRKLVDRARVTYAIAKANQTIGKQI